MLPRLSMEEKKYQDHLLEQLKDSREAAAYLNACLEDDDPRVFLLALKDVTDAQGGMTRLAKECSLNRQSLYRALSKTGNPRMFNVINILGSLGFEMQIRPSTRSH